MGGLCDFGVTPVPIGLGFRFGTALGLGFGLGLRGLDLGLGLDKKIMWPLNGPKIALITPEWPPKAPPSTVC